MTRERAAPDDRAASTRRRFLAGVSASAGLGLAGCVGLGDDGNAGSGAVAGAPIPGSPGAYDYAVMGDPSAAPTVTYFGNWKCPFCAQFSTGDGEVLGLGTIVSEYVEPGRLALQYRALSYTADGQPFLGPDAPRAARAGLAVWTLDPGTYWAYHEQVMANQPPEAREWATVDRLTRFARDAGVDGADELGDELSKGKYAELVRRTTEAAGAVGVSGTPALVADGQVVSPFRVEQARGLLDALAG